MLFRSGGEARGIAENHGDRRLRRVERHREVGAKICHTPARRLPSGPHIDDCDLTRIRHVDKGAAIFEVQLEVLGMS